MLKWGLPVAVLIVLVGLLLWKLARPEPRTTLDRNDATRPADRPGRLPSGQDPIRTDLGGGDAGPKPVAATKLDPKSEAYSRRLDIGVPARLRSSLAHCYTGGRDPDLTIRFRYHLQVHGGDASAIDVSIANSELGDANLEACMLRSIRDLRWREEDLPDTDEDDVLFVRLLTLVKYKSPEEQAHDKAVDHEAHLHDAGP